MAVGDEAFEQGYALVPDVGDEGLVRWGAREINRTRDYIAELRKGTPDSKAASRTASGIRSGTSLPNDGNDGDIFFKLV